MLYVYLVFVLVLILFSPIFVRFDILFDKEIKKMFMAVYFYGFIKIISGYFTIESKYVAFHLSDKKAILIEPLEIFDKGKSYKSLKNFEIFSVKTALEIGSDVTENWIKFTCLYKVLIENLSPYYLSKKYFAITNNDIIINETCSTIRFISSIKVVFNIFVILIMAIKKFMEKISNEK